MIITKQWIHDHKTPAGGWNRKQMTAIGFKWPPPKGWIKAVSGVDISDEVRKRFEAESDKSKAKESLEDRVIRLEAQIKRTYSVLKLLTEIIDDSQE